MRDLSRIDLDKLCCLVCAIGFSAVMLVLTLAVMIATIVVSLAKGIVTLVRGSPVTTCHNTLKTNETDN